MNALPLTMLQLMELCKTKRRNLTVAVSLLYNNTEIFCRAEGKPMTMNTDSEIAILIVQGI